MRYGNTLSTADSDDAKLALGNVQLAIADTEAEIAGTAETKLKSLVTALKAAVTADAAALDEVVKVAGDLRAKQAELMKASAAIDEQVNKISMKLGAVRAEQGEKTAAAVQHTAADGDPGARPVRCFWGTVLAWLIGASLSGPIRRMTDRMQSLAAGELDDAIPGGESRDEIGRMARAVEVFRENALAVRRMEQEAAAQHGVAEAGSPAHDVRARQPLRARHAGRDYGRRWPREEMGRSAEELARVA
jgi:HAMP domain-containing protein